MAIEVIIRCETADELFRDLRHLLLSGSPPAIVRPVAELAPNGPVEPGEQMAAEPVAAAPEPVAQTVVRLDKPAGPNPPRRGRPPKSEVVAPTAQAQEPQAVTPDDCIEAVKTLVNRTGDILAPGHVLSTFGVKKTRELTDDNRAAFVAACAAYVAEGSQAAGAEAK